jgi:hypothetical protein
MMKGWTWKVLLWPVALLGGCSRAPTAPIPALDAAAPAVTETATFALG